MKKNFFKAAAFVLAAIIVLSNTAPAYAYTVKRGDSLGKIADKYNMSVEELREMNGIPNGGAIYVGEELKVSKDESTAVTDNSDQNKNAKTNSTAKSSNTDKSNKATSSTTKNTAKKAKTDGKIDKNTANMLRGMFDAEYYSKTYPDVVKALGDKEDILFSHFITSGIWEGRQPNADFNVSVYACAYSDLAETAKKEGLSPKETILFMYNHYNSFGKKENRDITTVEKALKNKVIVKSIATADDEKGEPLAGSVIADPFPKTKASGTVDSGSSSGKSQGSQPEKKAEEEKEKEKAKKHVHSYSEKVLAAPTCQKDGLLEKTCTGCGDKILVTLKKNECFFVSHTESATCQKDGKTYDQCVVCGKIVNEKVIKKTGCKAGEPVITDRVEPTCTKDGSYIKTTYCVFCGAQTSQEKVVVPALGHDKSAGYVVTKQPTCTEKGQEQLICKTCGRVLDRQPINKTPHKYSKYTTKSEKDGREVHKCIFCGCEE